MRLSIYHSHILKYLHVSRQRPKNAQACAKVEAVRLLAVPRQAPRPLAASGALVSSISGATPACSYRYNKRYRRRFLAGAKVTLRRNGALSALFCMNTFLFYRSVNFRGFAKSPDNVTAGYQLGPLSFFRAASRAYDEGLLGFDDDSLDAFLSVSFSASGAAPFFLRGLRVPVYG